MTLQEQLNKDYPDKDIRIISLEPICIRYRNHRSSSSIKSECQATYENVKKYADECIKLLEGT